ncbi:MAG TPA: DNA polymerase Y family protein [Woeseiaceae bacterium]|nr:DNA polymerase Y family protein [Woeseiaceae bacterium]
MNALAGREAVPQQRALAFQVPPQAEEPPRRAAQARRLWLCIHLPALALEAQVLDNQVLDNQILDNQAFDNPVLDTLETRTPGTANAVFDEQQGMRRIVLANREAQRRGVVAGLSINAALALLPTLGLLSRNPPREEQALSNLAAWTERFTPRVSLEPPDALLLEIAGSVSLFGGRERLRQTIEAGLIERGFTISTALAPLPLAAVWLARAGIGISITDTEYLTGALSPLSLDCLRWPLPVRESLHGMGIHCIGDCLRLPRQGFVRRFGAARLLQLDRALGRLPDPRVSYRSPERFCRDYELAEEEGDRELLLHAGRVLLQELEGFLLTRQMAVQQLCFSFFHLQGAATGLTLGCLQPERVAAHWFDLLAMKFERLVLPAPVIAIRLRGGQAQPLQVASGDLQFESSARRRPGASIAPLLERLAARIGDGSVHGVTTVAEHRPQYAWNAVQATGRATGQATGNKIPQCAALPVPVPDPVPWHDGANSEQLADMRRTGRLLLRRPLWMLAEPLALASEGDIPHYQGPLRLAEGPERLETGWWDGKGIARDYFVAVNAHGVHLWVYRSRHGEADWYLHGIFG